QLSNSKMEVVCACPRVASAARAASFKSRNRTSEFRSSVCFQCYGLLGTEPHLRVPPTIRALVESSQFIQECGALAPYDGFMQPLIVLITMFLLLIIPLGWWDALRFALAAMFLLTASAHWGKRRPDLIRMVPSAFPRPDLIVTITGVLEIFGLI